MNFFFLFIGLLLLQRKGVKEKKGDREICNMLSSIFAEPILRRISWVKVSALLSSLK
jgi:hypothetical protein